MSLLQPELFNLDCVYDERDGDGRGVRGAEGGHFACFLASRQLSGCDNVQ